MLLKNDEDLQLSLHHETELLQRPHLQSVLAEASQKYAVSIVAGPGFGKTTAVSAFLSDQAPYTFWVSLTQLDNLDTRIWEHLCNTLRFQGVGISEDMEIPDSDYAFDHFVRILSKELDEKNRYYLVLDDFHNITNQTAINFFEKLILAQIPMLCIIVISRKEPAFHTMSLLSKNLLYRIDDESFRMTLEETSDYFEKQGILLLDQAKSELYQYTGGWIFATQLVCLSLEKNRLYQENPYAAVKLDIFGLLESEVFQALSDELKSLMIRLSLLESTPIELARVLAGEHPKLVDQALNIGSLVTLDKFTNALRIHPIFLDFLKNQQSSLSKADKDRILFHAAKWYEEKGYRIDAITYYEKIGRYDKMVGILLTFNKAYPAQTIDYLLGIIERMPKKLLAKYPILRFLHIKFRMNNFRMEGVHKDLLELQQELETLPRTKERTTALGEIYLHIAFERLISSNQTSTYDFVDAFKKVSEYIPGKSKLIHRPYVSVASYVCNVSSHQKGQIDRYIAAVSQIAPITAKFLPGTFEGYVSLAKAEVSYFRKDMKEAERCVRQAMREAHDATNTCIEINALFLLTRISVSSGKYTDAVHSLKQQRQLAQASNTKQDYAICDITSGWFYTQLGYTGLVSDWIKDEEQSSEVLTPITFAADKLVRARCLLHENKIYELLSLLGGQSEGFAFENYLFGRIEMKVLRAIALSQIKEYEESAQMLQEAYVLARPNEIIMPFVENGKYIRTLISHVSPYTDIPAEWLKNIQTKSTTYAKRVSSLSADFSASQNLHGHLPALSQRETDVLLSLCQGLTRDEMADALGLSANTVKGVINNIYNKLGVNNSMDAVRIAAKRNLL